MKAVASSEVMGLNFEGRNLKGINFNGAHIAGVVFDECTLDNCNFDNCHIERVSFRKANLVNCRFRKAHIEWSDFRYSEVNKATFEEAHLEFCDFYRAMLGGVVIMRKSRISNCSLYYTYFGEGVLLHKENFVGKRRRFLLQQNKKEYRRFLVEWNTYGCGERKNDQKNAKSDWIPEAALQNRWSDAEDIYKTLNGYWQGIGFLSDSNWAYCRARKMERKANIAAWRDASVGQKTVLSWKIVTNFLTDLFFGYGESMSKMILTYIALVLFFSFVYSDVALLTWVQSFVVSLKNMVGVGSDFIEGISPFLDMLNMIQTTLGILLTGIFGFILGNKIRNQ